jgi:hypothetical protein
MLPPLTLPAKVSITPEGIGFSVSVFLAVAEALLGSSRRRCEGVLPSGASSCST